MATTQSERPTHIVVDHAEPGDGETVSVAAARQANPGKRILAILVVSMVAAMVVLGGYWAINAPKLQRADLASGVDHGQAASTTTPGRAAPAGPGPG